MTVFICKGLSGQIHRVSIDPQKKISQLLADLLHQIDFFVLDPQQLGLYNLTQDFEYHIDKSFQEQNTREGDLILIADGSICHK